EVAEQCRRLLDSLDPDGLREVALAKLEGYTNEELARRLGWSVAKVGRKLKRIRHLWERLGAGEGGGARPADAEYLPRRGPGGDHARAEPIQRRVPFAPPGGGDRRSLRPLRGGVAGRPPPEHRGVSGRVGRGRPVAPAARAAQGRAGLPPV